MPTIQDNLTRLNNAKINIGEAIEYGGGTLSTGKFEGFPTDIINRYDEIDDTLEYLLYGYNTRTFTSLPGTFVADGEPLIDYSIYGNMTQTGTPTPSSPIYPKECGDIKNLFDFDSWADSIAFVYGDGIWSINDETITITSVNQADAYTAPYDNKTIYGASYKIFVKPNTHYTAKAYIFALGCRIVFFENGNVDTSDIHTLSSDGSISFTTKSTTTYLTFRCGISSNNPLGTTLTMGNIILNEGSTALPYEPYGYKIPIISGNTTTNIYLNEPLRKIGDYADTITSDGIVTRYIGVTDLNDYSFEYSSQSTVWSCNNIPNIKYSASATVLGLGIAEKYVNHTSSGLYLPVNNFSIGIKTVGVNTGSDSIEPSGKLWYVLTTPATEQFTSSTIPTINGEQTFDINTTLKPSEVDIKFIR